ncbi:MAG TPA: bifunctional methylenetetrahydrofolate dehydrogenase/methenyltetrahydrofolate cyclohydrolase FolD [Steroidobacteraceae bacterium]|nr:bifunctional methylenetetrahydrofolate dehydrogenase/methenyltetrahydrofolate cyclohydrolase FolD [Steroidobacteraceae bacterium]
MPAQLIDGRRLAEQIKADVRNAIATGVPQGARRPGLAVIKVGDDPASAIYVRGKRRACEELGITSFAYDLPVATPAGRLLGLIDELNADQRVHGILVQLPLPPHIDRTAVIERIDPAKDVDGFHPYNIGRLAQRIPCMRPCTPYGVIRLLEHIGAPFKGQNAVVVGASNIVGRPMALELLLTGATATVCHRFTADLREHVSRADILIVAAGKPGLIPGEWVRPGSTVIDVGMNRTAEGHLVGDVEHHAARQRAAWITPVPGGVGPMTVAMLMHNTLRASERQRAAHSQPRVAESSGRRVASG